MAPSAVGQTINCPLQDPPRGYHIDHFVPLCTIDIRVQQRSRQNHLLLARTLELMQRFMNGLFLASTSPVSVYDGTGVLPGRAMVPAHALYEAVG